MTKSSTSGSSQAQPGRASTRDSKPSAKKVAAFQAKTDSIQSPSQKPSNVIKSSARHGFTSIRACNPPVTSYSQTAATDADTYSDESGQPHHATLTVCLACDKGQNRRYEYCLAGDSTEFLLWTLQGSVNLRSLGFAREPYGPRNP